MPVLLSLGHGYTARALARRLLPKGWRILATTRDPAKLAELAATGVEPLLWPLGAPLPELTHVLSSIAPTASGDPVLTRAREMLAEISPAWVGYLSTTAVYGDHGGDWVDEGMPLTPASERGRWRLEAERDWAATGLPLHVFRLAGIYGPGRGPLDKLREGRARRIIKPGQVFSRIHVEDIAQALEASMARPRPGAVWNLCDDLPAPPEDVIAHGAELLGLPVPPSEPWETAEMTPMARSFYGESKRVRNDRIKRDLGLRLLYPTYREGLQADLSEIG